MKKAIIVTSRGGFINAFLLHDIDILQSLGYLVICCANDNGKGYIEDVLRKKNVKFYQVDFASKNPLSQGNIQLAKEHNVNLHLLGFRTDIPKLCNVADIGALPSTQEGLGLSGIEQLRCGVPIVASDVQGIKDYVINDKNGYMYAPYDASGFSSGIEKLIDVNTRIKMKEFCKKSVEAYNCRNSYKEMEEIYTEIDREVTKKK